jgi:hypothetical protein
MLDSKSPSGINEEAVAKSNPKVDVDQLRRARELVAELREEGVTRPAYSIGSPYRRRPIPQVARRQAGGSTD